MVLVLTLPVRSLHAVLPSMVNDIVHIIPLWGKDRAFSHDFLMFRNDNVLWAI